MRFLATCNPGTEDIAAEEIEWEVEDARVLDVREGYGRVVFESRGKPWLVLDQVYQLRSIHSVVRLVGEYRVSMGREGLREASEAARTSGVHRLIPLGATFAVRGERIGEGHEYTSVEIAAAVGEGVQRASLEEFGWSPMVRLASPSVVVYAEVEWDKLRIGVLLTGERSRHRRRYRVYDHPAALKATLAYAMLRMAGARDGESILDPMCGGGTVAIEAALLFENSRIYCVDINRRHVEGARLNVESARVAPRVTVIHGDARELTKIVGEESIDVAVSNPPYGIRLGDPIDVRVLYREFMPELYRTLRGGGRAAIITAEPGYLEEAARGAGFKVESRRKVRHGDLWTIVFIFSKP
ncbi:MAG: THUMP domain-containing protein [Desulfurococcales archaeon]|nr:THUMP domain-containing protein [Desulfurococcales archaeon]